MKISYLPWQKAVEDATGLRPDLSTLHRWRHRGLRTYLIGGRRMSTVADVHDFVQADSAPSQATERKGRSPAKRQRDLQRAQRQLTKEGV